MENDSFWSTVWHVLHVKLFEVAGAQINLFTVMTFVAVLAATMFLSRLARRAIRRGFEARGVTDPGTVGTITRLVHFAFIVVGVGLAVESAGIDVGTLFAAGAVFAVALGFAVQNVMQNFVSGVILLVERAIKPDDVIELDGQTVRVRRMGIRATVVRTLNDEDVIVPNGTLVQGSVTNYTFEDRVICLRLGVGVTYDSDLGLVKETLESVADGMEFRVADRPPVVLLTGFGDSAVCFEVSVAIDDPWRMARRRSELAFAVWRAFREKGIVMAFPQVDVHFDEPVTRGLARLGDAA
jgi:small-conductance mechanosensitive channel